MDIDKPMERKSISDEQSVENISDQILRSVFQPGQTNVTPKTMLWIVQVKPQFSSTCKGRQTV